MFTVFLQGANRGIGLGYHSFVDEFERICREHIREGRARAFAFIFYNMTHGLVRRALKSTNGFQVLNSASGKDLTVFYLHSGAVDGLSDNFNEKFLRILRVDEQITPPCIVFFRVNGENIEDLDFRAIDDEVGDSHLIVEELRRYISEYIDRINEQGNLSGISWIATEMLSGLLKKALLHAW